MIDPFYDMYKTARIMLERLENEHPTDALEHTLEIVACKETIGAVDASMPDIMHRYERNREIQTSFTTEQIDFICYQIGDWYLKWKNNIISNGEKVQHRLGFAKEELKSMICGE